VLGGDAGTPEPIVDASERVDSMTGTRNRRALNLAATAACIVAPASVAANAPSSLRLVAVLALFCVAPGAALLALLQPKDARVEPGLVIGISLGIVTVAAQSMLWLGAWRPELFTYALAGACLLPLALLESGAARKLQARTYPVRD
jgi:hypothetical protein